MLNNKNDIEFLDDDPYFYNYLKFNPKDKNNVLLFVKKCGLLLEFCRDFQNDYELALIACQ